MANTVNLFSIKVAGIDKLNAELEVLEKALKEVTKEINRQNKVIENYEKRLNSFAGVTRNLANAYLNAQSTLPNLISQQNQLTQQIGSTTTAINQNRQSLSERERIQRRLTQASTQEARETERLRQQLQQVTRETRNRVRAENSAEGSVNRMRTLMSGLVVEYNRADEATRRRLVPAIRQLQERINSANADIGRHQGYVGNYARALGGVTTKLIGSFGLVGGISMLANVLKSGFNTIKDFEQANANLASVLGTTRNNIKELTEDARRLGSTTAYTASEVSELQIALARLGFSRSEILQSTESVLLFASALDSGLGESAELAGAALRAFGLDASEMNRVVSVMAVATNKSAMNFSYLKTSMGVVAPVAKAFGFTIEDTVSLLGTLANAGFDASMSATATRNILLNLADANGKLAKKLGEPIRSLDQLVPALIKLRDSGVDLNTTLELTDKRSVAAFNQFLAGAEAIQKLRSEVTDVSEELRKMAEERMNTVQGSIKGLESAWEGLMLSFSNSSGVFKFIIDRMTDMVRQFEILMKFANGDVRGLSKNIRDGLNLTETVKYVNYFQKQAISGVDTEKAYLEEKLKLQNHLKILQGHFDVFDKANQSHGNNLKRALFIDTDTNKTLKDLKKQIDSTTASVGALDNAYEKLTKETTVTTSGGGGSSDDKTIKEAEKTAERRAKIILDNQKLIRQLESESEKYQLEQQAESIEKKLQLQKYENDKKVASLKEGLEKQKREIQDFQKKNNVESDPELDKTIADLTQAYNKAEKEASEKLYYDKKKLLEGYTLEEVKAYSERLKESKDFNTEDLKLTKSVIAEKQRLLDEKINKEIQKERVKLQRNYETEREIINATISNETEKERKLSKLDLENAQNKFALLKKEMEMRMENGTLSEDEIQRYKSLLKTLFDEIEVLSVNERRTSPLAKALGLDDADIEAIKEKAFQLASEVSSILSDMQLQSNEQWLKKETDKLEKAKSKELESLEQRKSKGIISEESYNNKKNELEQKYENQKLEIEKQAFEKEKGIKKKQAFMELALGIVRIWSQAGINAILGAVMTAALTATTMLNVAKINAQQFAEGGKVKRVKPGIVKESDGFKIKAANGDNLFATLKTGEVVLNEEQQKKLGGAPAFRAAGVPGFASGGIVGNTAGRADNRYPAPTPESAISRFEKANLQRGMDEKQVIKLINTIVGKKLDNTRFFVNESDITQTQKGMKRGSTTDSGIL